MSHEFDAAERHIGELSMESELLRERSRAAEGGRRLTREDASVEYIEILYNRIRRYSTIGNISPVAFEEMDQATTACAA